MIETFSMEMKLINKSLNSTYIFKTFNLIKYVTAIKSSVVKWENVPNSGLQWKILVN